MPNLNAWTRHDRFCNVAAIKILILTMHDAEQVVREVLAAGARGFVLKSGRSARSGRRVDALQHRRTFFTTRVTQMVLNGYLHQEKESQPSVKAVLTPRERRLFNSSPKARPARK